ncbi:hypothetical protein LTR85_004737 [Meristemomyces frigidus]|nr:hypothetical protein LTR85_004737 [Meristemomyces frigidus]
MAREPSSHPLHSVGEVPGPSSLPSASPASKFTTEALYEDVKRAYSDMFIFMQVSYAQKQVVDLNGQVTMLREVTEDLRLVSSWQSSFLGLSIAGQLLWDGLWRSVNVVGDRCRADILRQLRKGLKSISSRSAESLKSKSDIRIPEDDIAWSEEVFRELERFTETLQVLLAAIRLAYHSTTVNNDGNLPQGMISTLRSSMSKLQHKLYDSSGFPKADDTPATYEMREALKVADELARTMPVTSMNRHFEVPNPANNYYTGRRRQLEVIRQAFSDPYASTQKRLIIEGGPGSGKTELALKYAQEHKPAYWGVFWVDASSRSTAKQSYGKIALTGGVDSNERSAKHWLSGRSYPWLLIIDNVDDQEMKIHDLVPPGSLGCVLVTTRNPALGTAGDRCLKLVEMDDNEATELLLRAAVQPKPWTPKVTDLAVSICRHLYYLPLALVHAGNAIKNNICNLATFVTFFDSSATRIRRERTRTRSRRRSSSAVDSESMPIFGSSEILFESLEKRAETQQTYRDALELLQMFSYMHFNNIRLDLLVHSTIGPLQEAKAVERQHREESDRTWADRVRDTVRQVLRSKLFATPPVIPDVLKSDQNLVDERDIADLEKEVDLRLRQILSVLVSMGFINKLGYDQERDDERVIDRYHIHPLMHKWVRERKHLTSAEDAVFCQMATTVLSRAVRLLGGDTEDARSMRREMVPHIDHVRDCAVDIQKRIHDNHRRNKSAFPPSMPISYSKPNFGAMQAEENGRFSKVYLDAGSYSLAEKLLREVMAYVVPRLGDDHTITTLVKLGLSGAIWHQTRYNEASELLDQVYVSRRRRLGAEHPKTLEIMTTLGSSVLSQGFMTKSRLLQEAAYEGLARAYGHHDRRTLMCENEIGKVHWFLFNWDESVHHHKAALDGMRCLLSSEPSVEEDLLACTEDLAMSMMRLGGLSAAESVEMMRGAVQRRTELQGKEHPLTLLSGAKFGQALGNCQHFEEAETLLRETLRVGVQNYGEDHLVILAGKSWYAQVLMGMGQLDRAEKYFKETIDRAKYAKAAAKDGEHPDRIFHVWRLVQCLERQGKWQEALERCRELQDSIPKIGGHGLGPNHKFNGQLRQKIEALEVQLSQADRGNEPANLIVISTHSKQDNMRFFTITFLAAAVIAVAASAIDTQKYPAAAQITAAPTLTELDERGIFHISVKTTAWKKFTSKVGHDAKKIESELYSVFTNFGGHNNGDW